jgi:hypothetical protein
MAVTNADILGWLNENPNASPALIRETMAQAGVSANQYLSATGKPLVGAQTTTRTLGGIFPEGMLTDQTNPQATSLQQVVPPPPMAQTLLDTGVNTGYGTPTGVTLLPPPERVRGGPVQTNPDTSSAIIDLYQQVLGRPPESQAVIKEWERLFGNTIDPTEVAQFQQAAQLEKTKPIVANLKGQILSQGTTEQWKGTGKGSAEANATDMAEILAGINITDINQFGLITKEVPTYSSDDYGNQIQTGTQTVQVYGNKVTGQEVPITYGEFQKDNAFGGTFEGSGNTGYRVDLSTGKPIFYTTKGSSNTLFNLLADNPILNAAANVAAGYFGGPAGVGALQAAQGKNFKDVATATLLSYLGQQAGEYFGGGAPIDASNMNPAQFSDALETQLITEMQRSGLTNAQITQFLENASAADIASITSALPVTGASDTLLVNAAKTPITADSLINTLAQVPTVAVTATRPPEQVSPDVINAVTSILGGATTTPPTVEVTDKRPTQPDNQVTIPLITAPTTLNPPTVTTPAIPTSTPPTKDLTTSEKLKIAQIGLGAAGLLGAGSALSGGGSGATQYPIIPVPTDWTSPVKGVAPATTLPPIDFGNRNLLIGTQWEKFLDPNYGQVPEPIQYSQPSSLSYNDLMGILGSKQGYPAKSSLSINDIISGIQNQYGQAPVSTMG